MSPEKIIELAERKGVNRELLRWAWAFFSQARPDFQDDFDTMMNNYAVCLEVKMWDAATWLTMHETLANLAVALEKKPREERRKLLQEHPQSMAESSATTYQEVWATASCNVVALHSDPDKANEPDPVRKVRHMAVLELLRAFHDEMRGFLPRRSQIRPTYFEDLLGLESFRYFLDGEVLTDRRSLFDFDCRSLVALWHETFPSPEMGDNPNCCLSLLTWTHSAEVHRILTEWRAAFSPVSTPRLVADFKVTLGALDDASHYGHGLGCPANAKNIANYPYWSDPAAYAAYGRDEAHDRLFAASNFKAHVRAEMAADFARKSDEIVADSDRGWAALTDNGEDGDLDDVVEWARPWIRAVGDLCMFGIEARNHSVGSSASKRPVDNENGSGRASASERCAEVYLEVLMTVHSDIERNEGGFWDTTLKQNYPFDASELIEFWRRVQHPQDVIPWIESSSVRENLFSWTWAFYSDHHQTFQFGFREALADKERRRVEDNITEATAWELVRENLVILLLRYDAHHTERLCSNISAQTLIDNKDSTWKDCWIAAALKLVVDSQLFALEDIDVGNTHERLKNCYRAALELLWATHQDLRDNCPLRGQSFTRKASYFRRLLNLEPVLIPAILSAAATQEESQDTGDIPPEQMLITLFPFKVDSFIAFWKQSLRTEAFNMLLMIMDPEMIQHMRQFLSGVDKERAASNLAIDGARYLTSEGSLPLQGDQMEFLNVRKACLELLQCIYIDARDYPDGFCGSMQHHGPNKSVKRAIPVHKATSRSRGKGRARGRFM